MCCSSSVLNITLQVCSPGRASERAVSGNRRQTEICPGCAQCIHRWEMRKTLGLALGGGCANGAAHAGFLRALEEADIRPDYISGCSIGAVMGACYAHGMTALEIREEVLKLKTSSIADFAPNFIWKKSLFRTKKVKKLLLKYIGDGDIEGLQIPFTCIATDVFNARTVLLDKGPAVQAVLASLAVPGVFRPVEKDGQTLIDGSVLCRVPTKFVKDMGADVVVAVDVLKNIENPPEKIGNIVSMMIRSYELMDMQITKKTAELEKDIWDLYIEPDMSGLSQYTVKDLDITFDRGYAAGKACIPDLEMLLYGEVRHPAKADTDNTVLAGAETGTADSAKTGAGTVEVQIHNVSQK